MTIFKKGRHEIRDRLWRQELPQGVFPLGIEPSVRYRRVQFRLRSCFQCLHHTQPQDKPLFVGCKFRRIRRFTLIRGSAQNGGGLGAGLIISFCIQGVAAMLGDMGQRRAARERAVQFLFQHDLNPPDNLEEALGHFWSSQSATAIAGEKGRATWGQDVPLPPPSTEELAARLFADKLIRGVLEHLADLDEKIKDYAQNWDLNRMAVVDRNILRLAIYEMLHRQDIPPIVSINEAVDIAKKFSTQDSGKFVNGILDKIKGELTRSPAPVK